MNKKLFTIISLFIVIMAITGCSGDEVVVGPNPYIGGNKGLIANFESFGIEGDGNIEEMWDGETFPIEVKLQNKGEHDLAIGDVSVTLKGINLVDFNNIPTGTLLSIEEIEKISEVNENGGEGFIDFTSSEEGDAEYDINLSGSTYEIDVFADVVYEYKTYSAVPKVCFSRDRQDTSVCTIEEEKTMYSSGAPIQVQSAVEKSAGTNKIAIEFQIQNVGSGDVTIPGAEFDNRYNQLSFEVSDPETWECKSGGKLNEARLDTTGSAIIVCRINEALGEDEVTFTKQVDLTLKYDYKEIIQKTLRIKKQ